MTSDQRGPYTREEALRQTAKNLGTTVEDLEAAIKRFRDEDEKKIIPKYIGENVEHSKRKQKIDEIINHAKFMLPQCSVLNAIIKKLEEFRDEEL